MCIGVQKNVLEGDAVYMRLNPSVPAGSMVEMDCTDAYKLQLLRCVVAQFGVLAIHSGAGIFAM